MSRPGLSGVMFPGDDGAEHEFCGFVRVGGVEYRLLGYRDEGRELRWTLRLTPLPPPAARAGDAS